MSWCEANNLKMNVQKTEEMVIGYGLKYTQLLLLCCTVVSKFLQIHSHPRGHQMGGQRYHKY